MTDRANMPADAGPDVLCYEDIDKYPLAAMLSKQPNVRDPAPQADKSAMYVASLEQGANDIEGCTDVTNLDSMFLESDLNCDFHSSPSFTPSLSTEADLLLQELCEFETSVSWKAADFEPVRLLRTLPAPPPKRFYISRWRGFVKRIQERLRESTSSCITSDTDMK